MPTFFTRTGDDGFTGLLGEGRIPKYHPRAEAIGALDEATAALGIARAFCQSPQIPQLLLSIQRDLYHIMAETAATPENAPRFRVIGAQKVTWIEAQTEQISEMIELPNEFIVPGDSKAGAFLSLARTIIRRAERKIVELVHSGDIENKELMRYLNRLSSLCFVIELLENRVSGAQHYTLAKE